MKRLLLLLLLLPLSLLAQTTGQVTGVALDSLGNVVGGATITVCALGSSGIPCAPVTASTTSNGQGAFSVTVPVGTYTVTIFRLGVVATSSTVVVAPSNITVPNNIVGGTASFTNLTIGATQNGECAVTSTASLSAANLVCTTSSTKIHVWPGAGVVSGVGLTIAAQLQVDAGSQISGSPAINGSIQAGLYQIFTGTPALSSVASSQVWAAWFPGSDRGAQLNNAYTALQATDGGQIFQEGGRFNFSTPIVMTTSGKNVRIACPVEQTNFMFYTATTGTAFTLAGGGGDSNQGGTQIENCTFFGSGNANATVGIQLGVTGAGAGASGSSLRNVTIGSTPGATNGFGTGLQMGTNGFLSSLINLHIAGNNVGMAASGEGINIQGGVFEHNNTQLTVLSSATQVHAERTSFDDHTGTTGINVTNGQVTFMACHFENVGLGGGVYVTMSGGQVTLLGGELAEDRTTGTFPGFISASAGVLTVFGTTLGVGGTTVETQAFNLSGNVIANLMPVNISASANLPAIYNAAYTGGGVHSFPFKNTTNVLNEILAANTPAIDLIGNEASGRDFRVRENAGALEFVDITSGSAVRASVSSPAANVNFHVNQVIADLGTACTNGELALSAGWQSTGSATVTAVAGTGQTCSWTITTGTTTAANPTVTDTLTNLLPSVSIVCELNIHGGTHTAAAGEGFQQTTLSITAPVFTFNGTPTAGGTTYFVTRRCGP